MLFVALVGARGFHAILAALATLAAIVLLYVLDALPKDGGKITLLAIQNLATCGLLTIGGGIITSMTIRMQNALVEDTKRSADQARKQYEEFSRARRDSERSGIPDRKQTRRSFRVVVVVHTQIPHNSLRRNLRAGDARR